MKIALIGTHGVGKTTLAYEVCTRLKKAGHNVELVTEIARRSPFPVNEATTLEGQLWILHTQIAAELDAAQRAPYVVCDRAVLDNYCYLVNKCGRQPALEPWLERWLESYGLLVGVPLVEQPIFSETFRQPVLADGFRSPNEEFRRRIELMLKALLGQEPFARFGRDVLWLDGRTQAGWAEAVLAAIEKGGTKPAA
jgi:GTPase SAR1 family protein